ncbi:MAG: helix-turn-helix domain-containing protein [Bryobacteraceae bacterium]|nr:helix-turn-helix domain-containing protein [Bryobacteraceae bacterium]
MGFHQRIPRPPLDNFVDFLWLWRGDARPHMLERVLPTGAPEIILNLKEDQTRTYCPDSGILREATSGSVFSGVRTRHVVIDTAEQEHVLGVVFKPGGAMHAYDARDCGVPLDAIWNPRQVSTLRDRILSASDANAALDAMEQTLALMPQPPNPHRAVSHAVETLQRNPDVTRIAALACAASLSHKRFIERFKAAVGITPKRYCRILRFQQAVRLAHRATESDWTRVAADCGYFDQSHFIRDFREFSGLTPAAYRKAVTEFPNHVKFLQYESAGE